MRYIIFVEYGYMAYFIDNFFSRHDAAVQAFRFRHCDGLAFLDMISGMLALSPPFKRWAEMWVYS